MKNGKKHLFLGFFLALLLVTALTVVNLKIPQDPRSRAAAGSTTLSLVPASSTKQTGDKVDIDMMINPGTNLVSFVRFQIKYDPTKLDLMDPNPFTINTASFPINVEGPVFGTGLLGQSVSIGVDLTKAIQKTAKVGTLHFTAIGSTGSTPTIISFTSLTQALSAGTGDKAYESVLASTKPASVTIGGESNITTTPNPTTSLTPSNKPTGTTTQTTVTFDLLLHGVGSAGDNPNPKGNSLSNKSPLHPQRNLSVQIFNGSNQLVSSASGGINFDAGSGSFKGSISFSQAIKEDNYIIKVLTPRYLRRRIPGVQKIVPLKDNKIVKTDLVAGDTNGDNLINIIDYNAFLDCGYGRVNPLPMDDLNSIFNKKACQIHTPAVNIDIDDNGIIDSTDYNLFLRELSVQKGD